MSYWKLLTARWGSGAGETDEVVMDSSSLGLRMITQPHYKVHSGEAFHAWVYDEDAASGHTIEIQFTTPATPLMHLIIKHTAVGEHLFTFQEGSTYSSGGDAFTPLNRRRDAGASTLTGFRVGSNPGTNIVTGGSPVMLEAMWTGTRGASASSRGVDEWLLKASTQYEIQMTAKAAGVLMFLGLDWYENTDSH